MKFKGSIIITDPCYVLSKDWDNDKFDIFDGTGLDELGFTNYLYEDTLYGDWSCTVYEIPKDYENKLPSKIFKKKQLKSLGEFCADAGLVGVFLLDEVLKYNPEFDWHITKKFTTCLIEDFDGDVDPIFENDELFIKGVGNINFISTQTGC